MAWVTHLHRILTRRNLRLAILASSASAYGDWFYMIALRGLMLELGGVAALTLSTVLPYAAAIAATPIAGWVADRFSRRGVLVAADLVRGLAVLAVAWLVATQRATAACVIALIMLSSVFGAMYRAARLSFMPMIAEEEDLLALNALDGAVSTSAVLLAPAIAGALAMGGMARPWFFLIDGVSFLAAIALVLRMRVAPRERRPRPGGGRASWRAALRLLVANRRIRWTAGVLLLSYLGGGASFLLVPLMSASFAGGGDAAIGYVTSALGLGVVLGMLTSGRLGRAAPRRTAAAAIAAFGLSLAASAVCDGATVLVAAAAIGYFPSLADPLLFTALQHGVPDELSGRFFALLESGIIVALMAGGGLYGVATDLGGAHASALIVGLIVATGALACAFTLGSAESSEQ